MTQSQFVARRGEAWERLEALLGTAARRGLRRMSADDVVEIGRLYRWVTSDLAYAQGHAFEPSLQAYLNRLVARAHAQVYRGAAQSGRERLIAFFTQTFPREFRASFWWIGACIALTVAAAMIAYAGVRIDADRALAMLPPGVVPPHIEKSLHDSNFAFKPEDSSVVSAEIITNNIRVAAFAFALGIVSLGVYTFWIILENGLMVGAMGALYTQAGFGYDYWATIAPHGVIELTAIQISGGAGLLLAGAVLFPGRMRRRDALRAAGRRAGVLIAGVCAMLLVAGTIEGFFSPLRFGPEVRLSVGAVTAAALLAYFGFCGLARPARAV